MIFGFTGTKNGMQPAQQMKFIWLLSELQVTHLHHGCCVGADIQANAFARTLGIRTEGWPSDRGTYRQCELDAEHISYPPLVRDKFIVEHGTNGLIATPDSATERVRSGTWTTVRYARKMNRAIWIVIPDGTVRVEPSKVLTL